METDDKTKLDPLSAINRSGLVRVKGPGAGLVNIYEGRLGDSVGVGEGVVKEVALVRSAVSYC